MGGVRVSESRSAQWAWGGTSRTGPERGGRPARPRPPPGLATYPRLPPALHHAVVLPDHGPPGGELSGPPLLVGRLCKTEQGSGLSSTGLGGPRVPTVLHLCWAELGLGSRVGSGKVFTPWASPSWLRGLQQRASSTQPSLGHQHPRRPLPRAPLALSSVSQGHFHPAWRGLTSHASRGNADTLGFRVGRGWELRPGKQLGNQGWRPVTSRAARSAQRPCESGPEV